VALIPNRTSGEDRPMASVNIFNAELKNGLPNVCMRCGQDATTFVRKTFSVYEYDSAIPGDGAIAGRRVTVHLPMCNPHRFHWLVYYAVSIGGFAFLMSTFFLGIFTASVQSSPVAQAELLRYVLLGSLCFGTLWLVVSVYLCVTRIDAHYCTCEWISFCGRSEQFCDALEDRREKEDLPHIEGEPDIFQEIRGQLERDPSLDKMDS